MIPFFPEFSTRRKKKEEDKKVFFNSSEFGYSWEISGSMAFRLFPPPDRRTNVETLLSG
jgi:hypothetical protein